MSSKSRFLAPVGILLLLLGILVAPVSNDARWFQVASNAAHGFVFAIVAILVLRGLKLSERTARWPLRNQYLYALIVAIGLGAATELLQFPLARDPSWLDFLNDLLGAWIGVGIVACRDSRIMQRARLTLATAGILSIAIVIYPVALCISAYHVRVAAFPVIADFRNSMNDYFLDPQAVTLQHQVLPSPWSIDPDERALHIVFLEDRWPGIEWFEVEANWEGFEYLVLDLTNSSESALDVNVRVHDETHNFEFDDRFNSDFLLLPNSRSNRRISIEAIRNAPISRPINLRKVAALILFVDGTKDAGRDVFLSRIWLE